MLHAHRTLSGTLPYRQWGRSQIFHQNRLITRCLNILAERWSSMKRSHCSCLSTSYSSGITPRNLLKLLAQLCMRIIDCRKFTVYTYKDSRQYTRTHKYYVQKMEWQIRRYIIIVHRKAVILESCFTSLTKKYTRKTEQPSIQVAGIYLVTSKPPYAGYLLRWV